MAMTILGIDPSLTGTGIVVLDDHGELLTMFTIKSKPEGDLPKQELHRIKGILAEILKCVAKYEPMLCVIEGIAFGIRGKTTSLDQLTGLNYLIRDACSQYHIPFVIVAPTSNKKFATGSGKGEKDMVLMQILKRWQVECGNNNEADAFSLARIGLILADIYKAETKPQQEVVDLIKKQL